MIFESFTFKPNPKKVKEDNLKKLYIAGGIIFLILVYVFLFRGLLSIFILGVIAYSVIQLEINDNKKKGANRFGSLVERFSLTRNTLAIGERKFNIDELQKIEINADDFFGKSQDFFVPCAGTDNTIEFSHAGTDYSFQFQVKKRADLKVISEIINEIKTRLPKPSEL